MSITCSWKKVSMSGSPGSKKRGASGSGTGSHSVGDWPYAFLDLFFGFGPWINSSARSNIRSARSTVVRHFSGIPSIPLKAPRIAPPIAPALSRSRQLLTTWSMPSSKPGRLAQGLPGARSKQSSNTCFHMNRPVVSQMNFEGLSRRRR